MHTADPGLHVHTCEDEASYIIAAVVTYKVGDEIFEAGPETLVWLPRSLPHGTTGLPGRVLYRMINLGNASEAPPSRPAEAAHVIAKDR